jgi:hypothetical protein
MARVGIGDSEFIRVSRHDFVKGGAARPAFSIFPKSIVYGWQAKGKRK